MTNQLSILSCGAALLSLLLAACTGESNSRSELVAEKDSSNMTNFKILILGDSITEGYGVLESEAYPHLLEERLNREISSRTKRSYEVINGGITGSTTSGGVSRIQWFLRAKPHYLIIALGGNDGLRGVPIEETRKNLSMILQTAAENQIPSMLAGMKLPPNYGRSYTEKFENLFLNLAQEAKVPQVPFLLEGVGGQPEFNLPDLIHPNPAGHRKICDLIFPLLSRELEALSYKP